MLDGPPAAAMRWACFGRVRGGDAEREGEGEIPAQPALRNPPKIPGGGWAKPSEADTGSVWCDSYAGCDASVDGVIAAHRSGNAGVTPAQSAAAEGRWARWGKAGGCGSAAGCISGACWGCWGRAGGCESAAGCVKRWGRRLWRHTEWPALFVTLVATVALLLITWRAADMVHTLTPEFRQTALERMVDDPEQVWGVCVNAQDALRNPASQIRNVTFQVACADAGGQQQIADVGSVLAATVLTMVYAAEGDPSGKYCYPMGFALDAHVTDSMSTADVAQRFNQTYMAYCQDKVVPVCADICQITDIMAQFNGGGAPGYELRDLIIYDDRLVIRISSDEGTSRIDYVMGLGTDAMYVLDRHSQGTDFRVELPVNVTHTLAAALERETNITCTEGFPAQLNVKEGSIHVSPYQCVDKVQDTYWDSYSGFYSLAKAADRFSFVGIRGGYDDMYAVYTGVLAGVFTTAATLLGLVFWALLNACFGEEPD